MAIDRRLQRIINDSIVEINSQRSTDQQLSLDITEPLFGTGSSLDSLGFVQLIVEIEQRFEVEFGKRPNLTEYIGSQEDDSSNVSFYTLSSRLKKFLDGFIYPSVKKVGTV